MIGVQAKLLAILASLLTVLPPSACCLLVLQPCCALGTSSACCVRQLAEPVAPSCCSHQVVRQVGKLPTTPAGNAPSPGQLCYCTKSPAIIPVASAAWQPELSVPLYLLPANWGTSQSIVSGVAPAWAMHPPSAARHVLLCVWRC